MKKYNLTLFGVKETTSILANYLHQQGIKIDLIISIDHCVLMNNHIANYTDLEATAKTIGADYYCVSDYSLKDTAHSFFQEHKFNTGIVYGWQRLIPEAVLAMFNVGVFGFHASSELLPYGKGRSPLNWGLILGKTVLYNHCFKYAVHADAGDIYSVTQFSINAHDTILTLLYKSLLTAKEQVKNLIHDIQANNLQLTSQQGESFYLPKRTIDDGLIDFSTQNTNSIVNLIRGVTKPFPGAFCYINSSQKIIIWEAWPFDNLLDFSNAHEGEVIDTLYDLPIIKTIDGSIILYQYEGATLKQHDLLTHVLDVQANL